MALPNWNIYSKDWIVVDSEMVYGVHHLTVRTVYAVQLDGLYGTVYAVQLDGLDGTVYASVLRSTIRIH